MRARRASRAIVVAACAAAAVAWSLAAAIAAAPAAAQTAKPTLKAAPKTKPKSVLKAAPALPDGRAIMERCVRAWYYAGDDAVARIRMELVDRAGATRYRLMTMFRLNLPGEEQRYLLYFHEPGDVRRMTCMVSKHPGGNDERWMFVPAAGEVRRVSAPERSRFLGSDFLREEFAGRSASEDTHRLERFEVLEGKPCWVVESVSKKPVDYASVTTWVDTTTALPWKQEFRDRRGSIYRTYVTDKVAMIDGPGGRKIPTITERTLWARGNTSHTRLLVESIRYGVGLESADFKQAHLLVPLDSWYRGPMP
ncbi:MAG TPA: outer membrane lipoprotein-sorting protein [Acidobacteriota bacterium]|nr:outer membrane lipoprotein-sorting protein [Acidobacteriota bacterium]